MPPSEAKVQAAKANADRTRDEFERASALVGQHAVSEQEAVGKRLLYEQAVQQWHQAQREHALLLAGAWKPDLDSPAPPSSRPTPRSTRSAPRSSGPPCGRRSMARCCKSTCARGNGSTEQSSQALMVLGRLPPLHVRADIDEHDIAEFRPDAKAVLQLRGKNDRHYRSGSCGSSRMSWPSAG